MESTESGRKSELGEPEAVPAAEARDRLTDLMDRACFLDERFVFTRNGKPIAALISVDRLKRLEQLAAA